LRDLPGQPRQQRAGDAETQVLARSVSRQRPFRQSAGGSHKQVKNLFNLNPFLFSISWVFSPKTAGSAWPAVFDNAFAMPKSDQLSDEEILVKHAFRGSSFAVVRLEELTEISNLKADAVACYRPLNGQELFAIERIAICQQQLLRGARLESGLFTTALDYCLEGDGRTFRPMHPNLVGDGDIEITRAQNRNFAAGEGLRIMVKESNVWSILLRYQVNAERQYRRAIEDFERLKRLRPEMPNHPDTGTAPDVIDDIAPIREINLTICLETPRLEPESCAAEPAATSSVEAPVTSEHGKPLAPAASILKTHTSTSRIGVMPPKATPEAERLKVKPFTSPLRRPNKLRSASSPSSPLPASPPRRAVCRPIERDISAVIEGNRHSSIE
jgi:hypothetical protein